MKYPISAEREGELGGDGWGPSACSENLYWFDSLAHFNLFYAALQVLD